MSQSIFLAGGCFWCTEAIFLSVDGVIEVVPVYLGGKKENPTYNEVCSGNTGHAEAVRCVFDENKITLSKILEVFFKTHNPTELNKQGNDIGTQYRSEIFITDKKQLENAKKAIMDASVLWNSKVHTKITMLEKFYVAEDYHHNYYENNKNANYCRFIIKPKLDNFKKVFSNNLKKKLP